jgi:hypothetical protein
MCMGVSGSCCCCCTVEGDSLARATRLSFTKLLLCTTNISTSFCKLCTSLQLKLTTFHSLFLQRKGMIYPLLFRNLLWMNYVGVPLFVFILYDAIVDILHFAYFFHYKVHFRTTNGRKALLTLQMQSSYLR